MKNKEQKDLLKGHGRVICKVCGDIIITCKCLKCSDNIIYTVCDDCLKEKGVE